MAELKTRATGAEPRMWGCSMAGFDRHAALMAKLGKFRAGKSCLYIKRLSDVDPKVLRELVKSSVKYMKATYKSA